MFYGYEVKSNYNQAKPILLPNNLKLSQAVLEPTKNGKREPVTLMIEHDNKQYIICVLDPNLSWQCPLDLIFDAGSEFKFFLKGSGTVHLTGYDFQDDSDDMSLMVSSESDLEEDEPMVVAKNNNSAKKSPKAKTNGVAKPIPTKKNGKINGVPDTHDEDEDDDESDDEDYDFGDLNDDSDEDDDDDDDDDIEDEDMDDEDASDESLDEDDESDDE